MIFDKQGNTITITQETVSITEFLKRLTASYEKMKHDNIIINLFSLEELTLNNLLEFLPISNQHRKTKKSFVIVTQKIKYNDVPNELIVVPTLQEALDIVQMEEIERDLDL